MEEEIKTKTKIADLKPNPTKKSIPTIAEIEQFVIDHGSDDIATFGGTTIGGNFCQQTPDEIANCIHYFLSNNVPINSYLEVGAAAGGTTFLFNHYFHPSQIVIVDNNSHPKCQIRRNVLTGLDFIEIIDDSQSEEAIRRTGKYAPFDLVILDAVHTYVETMMDVVHYSPFLSPGGYLFLHDSVWMGGNVARVVKELKTHQLFTFINEWVSEVHTTNPCGIALFSKKGGV
jgi:cephalosporin hydroxylase